MIGTTDGGRSQQFERENNGATMTLVLIIIQSHITESLILSNSLAMGLFSGWKIA